MQVRRPKHTSKSVKIKDVATAGSRELYTQTPLVAVHFKTPVESIG